MLKTRHIAFVDEGIGRKATLLMIFYVLAALSYLTWRTVITIGWQTWYAWPLLISELIGIFMAITYLWLSKRVLRPKHIPISEELKNAKVDVFIPTYNEPENIVRTTVLGAVQIQGVNKIFVLDDGNRDHIKKMARSLGVEYVARKERDHAKAGNLNNALQHSDADFIVCLDCDHVPKKTLIERTLGYFIDPNLAFVQTPQTFHNTGSVQFRSTGSHANWNEQSMFYESIQLTKNAYNAAFFCGSGAVIRRSALDAVGGFATGTITEDIHTSVRLHALGYSSLFVPEQLAYGLAPDDFMEYHKQRIRWSEGGLNLLFRSPDSPLRVSGLSFMQRVCYTHSMISCLVGLQRLFYYVLPIFMIGSLFFAANNPTVPVLFYLAIFISFLTFSYAITYLFSHKTFHPLYSEQFNIANIFSTLVALRGVFFVQKKFVVSAKDKQYSSVPRSYSIITVLWVAMLVAQIAGIGYWLGYMQGSVAVLLSSMLAIALFWNGFNLFFLWSFLRFVKAHTPAHPKGTVVACEQAHLSFTFDNTSFVTHANVLFLGVERAVLVAKTRIPVSELQVTIADIALDCQVTSQEFQDGSYHVHISFPRLLEKQQLAMTYFVFNHAAPKLYQQPVASKKQFALWQSYFQR